MENGLEDMMGWAEGWDGGWYRMRDGMEDGIG